MKITVMTAKLSVLAFAVSIFPLLASSALGQTYEVPPSDPTITNPQSISDDQMKRCVVLYNELEDLPAKIERDRLQVDSSSQASVDAFNSQIETLDHMNADYNENCEGKSSESAEKNTRELNNQGQP
jgi:hypothetical protein